MIQSVLGFEDSLETVVAAAEDVLVRELFDEIVADLTAPPPTTTVAEHRTPREAGPLLVDPVALMSRDSIARQHSSASERSPPAAHRRLFVDPRLS